MPIYPKNILNYSTTKLKDAEPQITAPLKLVLDKSSLSK